jgi:hypothetical protein
MSIFCPSSGLFPVHATSSPVRATSSNVQASVRTSTNLSAIAIFLLVLACSAVAVAQNDGFQPNPSAGAGTIIVHSKFGGQIYGFDIDQNGTEGLLSEAILLSNGNYHAAVETFDQATGKILDVVTQTDDQDDFVTEGVMGTSVGLFEHEHSISLFDVKRIFQTINPLSSNKISGKWTPPIGTGHLIEPGGISRSQGTTEAGVFAYDNTGAFTPWVFETDVAANTFGTVVKVTDSNNFGSVFPPIAFDSITSQVIMGGGNGCFGCRPVIGLVNAATGTFSEFTGSGFGFVNGIAVDAADGIFCTDTEDDATVEFYNLSTQKVLAEVTLPGSGGQQIFSGADVEFDPINKLFLVAQPDSSSSSSGSTIYVYDTQGNLQETLNGFSFSNAFNVVPMYIAIKPSTRTGFVNGPNAGVTELQSFTY